MPDQNPIDQRQGLDRARTRVNFNRRHSGGPILSFLLDTSCSKLSEELIKAL